MVVAPVGDDLVGPLAWTSDPTCDGRDAVHEREQLSDVVAVPARQVTVSGTPAASTSRWCLEPVRARSTSEGPIRPPSISVNKYKARLASLRQVLDEEFS